MSEELNGTISIGGKVTRKQWEEMCKCEGLLEGWKPEDGAETEDGAEIEDYLQPTALYLSTDGHVVIDDPLASYGMFSELEDYLVKEGIPFDRDSATGYDYDASTASFRSGMERVLEGDALNGGEIVVAAEDVARFISEVGKTIFDKNFTSEDFENLDDILGNGWKIYKIRKKQPLPKFEFVEE